MLIVVLFVFLFLLYYYIYIVNNKINVSVKIRETYIISFIIYSLVAYTFTELFSVFNLVTRESFFVAYLIIDILLVFLIIKASKQRTLSSKLKISEISSGDKLLLLLFLFFIVIPLIFLAIYFPPHIWDSLTYHLPRIEQWIQNGNVKHFPTNDERQLYFQPFSEYLILQFRILCGNDFFDSSVQLAGYFATIITVSLLIRHFNGNKHTQIFGALIVSSVPIVLNQATTTQNDLLMSSFFIIFIYFGLKSLGKRWDINSLVYATLAFAFGMLTKASVYVFGLPFILFFAIVLFIRFRQKIIKFSLMLILIVGYINGPYFYRNYSLTGNLFGSSKIVSKTKVDNISFSNTVSNIIRTNGMLMGLPISSYNHIVDNVVTKSVNLVGKELNDKSNTMPLHKYKTIFNRNSLHYYFLIFNIFFLIVFLILGKKTNSYLLWVFVLSLLGFIIHSMVFRWSVISSTRYYIPLMIPLLTAASVIFGKFVMDTKYLKYLSFFMLFIVGFQIFTNGQKPIFNLRDYVKIKTKYLPKTIKSTNKIFELEKNQKELFNRCYSLTDRFTYPFYSKKEGLSKHINDSLFDVLTENGIINYNRSIFKNSREENYFYNYPMFKDGYMKLIEILRNRKIRLIGLNISNEDFEYIIRRLYMNRFEKAIFYNIVFPEYLKKSYNYKFNFNPDAIITNDPNFESYYKNIKKFNKIIIFRDLKLYLKIKN